MRTRRTMAIAVAGAMMASTLIASAGLAQDASPSPAPSDASAAPADAGPLTGDLSVIPQEVSCIQDYASDPNNSYRNYYPAIGSPEHTDAIHSGVQPCATFTGTLDGDNVVYQHISDPEYLQINFVVFKGPDDAYLLANGFELPSYGSYVSKFNPQSGKEIWRTQVQNLATTGDWLAFGSIAVHENGYIYVAVGNTVLKLDPDTGAILASGDQPILDGGEENANFDGFHFAPDKTGTILLKSQNRSPGCTTQGNFAMTSCQADFGPQPNTTVVAVDPDTLENLDAVELSQQITARPVVTSYDGKIYIYQAGTTTLQRVQWNPHKHKLTIDESWAPEYLLDGQSTGSAPGILGDWVIANQNAQGGTVPQCVVAVHQGDPTNLQRHCPWGQDPLPDGQASSTLGSFGVDPDLNLVFAQDPTLGGVYAVSVDPDTGEMETAWGREDWYTSDYFSMVGDPDNRVLINAYFNPDDFSMQSYADTSYTEALEWADAQTGETIVRSAYNPSTALGSLPNLGYGGRVYMMGNNGSLFIYQVEEAPTTDAATADSDG